MSLIKVSIFFYCLLLSLCINSFAQELSEAGFYAEIKSAVKYDDNIYRVPESLAVSDEIFKLEPTLDYFAGYGKQRFGISYKGDLARYTTFDAANYIDNEIKGIAELSHSVRMNSQIEIGYRKDHEEPGSLNRIQLDINEYNKFEEKFYIAEFSYGQNDSIGKVTTSYKNLTKNYTTNNLTYLNFLTDQFLLNFTYRVTPKIRTYVEAVTNDYDYDEGITFELDNTYTRYRIGLKWDFDEILSGNANVGYQSRDYDEKQLRDISGLAYDARVVWNNTSYSRIILIGKRESIDSSIEDTSGFLRTTYGIDLNYSLNEKIEIELLFNFANDELVFSSSREDKRYNAKIALDYEFTRLITFGLTYDYDERESTQDIADYKSNTVTISMTLYLD